MVDFTMVGTVVGISVICYLVGAGCKAYKKIPNEWIPVIVGAIGGVIGAAGMYVIPDFPAKDIINAFAVGIASGLASTGANQITKIGK